ncbi:histidine kinase dimerization/phospho-acceptor domain-containing protein [Nocardioides nematodiphilus]|uniref:histidine kinase dimerization/phospho-acceptor domain-containing protein n=1 Tax=Nocardioides nematodiphilus TaxID=2849669 RepID=UPI001CD9C927|nr:histidine kinase dimerization/phospho-acceptor domain-containing protein [Nocardioides nematodiphilus]MCA1984780.1 hypothetical protein [Nocardioides nematodiphilus]
MRRRRTPLFVLLVLLLTSLGYLLRTWSLEHRVRDHDDALLRQNAVAIAVAVRQRAAAAERIDADFLTPMIGENMGLRYHSVHGTDIDVRRNGFDGTLGPQDGNRNLWASAPVQGYGYVLLSEDDDVVQRVVWDGTMTILLMLLAVGLTAAVVGVALARAYERPFHRLAEAAAALGRGRFQLDLQPSHIPAANAIAQALEASAHQLQDRMATEDELAQRASHVLRTPLTGLRLELEEAALDETLRPETAATLQRSLTRIDQLDAVTGELVALARQRALVAEAAIDLGTLARQLTQRWADELDVRHRSLSAAVEGDAATTYTPGPVEQILELLFAELVHRSAGAVRLVFTAGTDGHLRITITAESAVAVRKASTAPLQRARTIAMALGGRLEGEYADGGLEVVLPRR